MANSFPVEPLLGHDDPPAFRVINEEATTPIVLICDHAGHAVPGKLGDLGLDLASRTQHIGWDIGAAIVTQILAERLSAPAFLSTYSRLVVDCNRDLHDPTAFPAISDGIVVPGNQELSAMDRAARVEACFTPYHRAIERCLDQFTAKGIAPAVISIHSFTPMMQGVTRPWQVGILWDQDPRLAVPLIANLAALHRLTVGDNEPYSAREPQGYSLRYHAAPRGLPHVLIELRQDEICLPAGAELYADYLVSALSPILADPLLFRSAHYQ